MTDDLKLVERLRNPDYAGDLQHLRSAYEIDNLMRQSADAIERLVRERDEAREHDARTMEVTDIAVALPGSEADRIKRICQRAMGAYQQERDMEVLRADRDRLAALVAEMREALEPFGRMADAYFHRYETRPGEFREAHQDKPNDVTVYGFNDASLTVGHLRRARALLDDRERLVADAGRAALKEQTP